MGWGEQGKDKRQRGSESSVTQDPPCPTPWAWSHPTPKDHSCLPRQPLGALKLDYIPSLLLPATMIKAGTLVPGPVLSTAPRESPSHESNFLWLCLVAFWKSNVVAYPYFLFCFVLFCLTGFSCSSAWLPTCSLNEDVLKLLTLLPLGAGIVSVAQYAWLQSPLCYHRHHPWITLSNADSQVPH